MPGTPGDARRQPPSRDRNDPNAHRGGRGGYHYPYYYPYGYGYRYYGGPGWWWAPYGYWGWFWWGHDTYYDDYYYGDRYYRGRQYSGEREIGALDLDVSPGRTQVWLDGQYIGTVDQYDGFPTYLWLEKGTYDLAFYLDGYKTVARQVSVYPGTVIDFDDRLEPGESVKPEDLATKTHDRRDERIRFERERRERLERGEQEIEEDESWRDRVRREREDRRDRGEGIEIEIPDDRDERSEQGRVRLEIEPDDASVYLDGKFIGTAQDLASLRRGLLVEPGDHTVAVVRPGRESVEREFEVEAGEEVELEIELEPASR